MPSVRSLIGEEAHEVLSLRAWGWLPDPRRWPAQVAVFALAFAVPVVGLISPQAVQVALFVAAAAAAITLGLDGRLLARLAPMMRSPWLALAVILMVFVALQSLRFVDGQSLGDAAQRPLLIAALVVLVAFVAALRDELAAELRLSGYLQSGLVVGAGLLVALLIYQLIVMTLAPPPWHDRLAKNVREINRYLEISAILVFLLAAIPGRHRQLVLLAAAIYAASLVAVGYWPPNQQITRVASDTVQLGMPIALAVLAAAHRWPRTACGAVFGIIGGYMALAPWLHAVAFRALPWVIPFRRDLILDRAEIWAGVAARVRDGSWQEFLLGRGREFLRFDANFPIDGTYAKELPFHPHNMVLQLWLDMGLAGVLLLLAFLWLLHECVATAAAQRRPGLLACFVMLMLSCAVTHSLWQMWFLSVVMATLALLIGVSGVPLVPGSGAASSQSKH